MRTELYKVQKYGGTLLRPLFAEYPTDDSIDPNDLSTLMFGSAIKVDFNFNKSPTKKIYFPETKWVDLNTFKVYQHTKPFTENAIPAGLDTVNMFQKGKTIVALRDIANRPVLKVEDLKTVPLTLSVALDGGEANGQVYVEDGL